MTDQAGGGDRMPNAAAAGDWAWECASEGSRDLGRILAKSASRLLLDMFQSRQLSDGRWEVDGEIPNVDFR